MIPSYNALARKLTAFAVLAPPDLAVLAELHGRRRKFAEGTDLVFEGQHDQPAFILTRGWVCSYKLTSGGGRQVIDFQIPGDFLGFRSLVLRAASYNVEPITPIVAAEVFLTDLLRAMAETPRLGTALMWAASRDEAMLVEHLVGLGRRNAAERTAHLLLELAARLRLVGMGDTTGYNCPLSQYLIADAMGLSAVHVNRVLRELREAELVTFQRGRVEFQDFDGLVRFADFDRTYLDHEGPLLR